MFDSKYGKVLTIFLIIAILAIIGLVTFWIIDNINGDKIKKDQSAGIEEFNKDHGIVSDATPDVEETPNDDGDVDDGEVPDIIETTPTPSTNNGGSSSSGSSGNKTTTYYGFTMLGYIEIPKTGVEIPIVDKATKKSLEVAVAVLYPLEPSLNEAGNTVIAGHNYRNGTFFSNNKKLQEGDKIYITDETGRKTTYVVYKNFEAAPEDTSFYIRDTDGVPEITLTTCTQDSSKRTIILAKAQ